MLTVRNNEHVWETTNEVVLSDVAEGETAREWQASHTDELGNNLGVGVVATERTSEGWE